MAEIPPAPAAEIWLDNPNVGNFNPGKKLGQEIFEKKTKGLKEEKRLAETKKDAQAICSFLGNKSPALGKFVTRIPIKYNARRDTTECGNLLCEYGSISMNLLQREAHKFFSNPVAADDHFPAAPFVVTTLDPANDDNNNKLFYSWVYSQFVAELIKNILTDAEYSNLMLKNNMFTYQDYTTGNEIIDGPCLLKLLFYIIDPNVFVGVEVLCQNLKATKLHPYQNDVDAMLADME